MTDIFPDLWETLGQFYKDSLANLERQICYGKKNCVSRALCETVYIGYKIHCTTEPKVLRRYGSQGGCLAPGGLTALQIVSRKQQ